MKTAGFLSPFVSSSVILFDPEDINDLSRLSGRANLGCLDHKRLHKAFSAAWQSAAYEAARPNKSQVAAHSKKIRELASALLEQLGCPPDIGDYANFAWPLNLPAFSLLGKTLLDTELLPAVASQTAAVLAAHHETERTKARRDGNPDADRLDRIATYEGLLTVLPAALAAVAELSARAPGIAGFPLVKPGRKQNIFAIELFCQLAGAYQAIHGDLPKGRDGKSGDPCAQTVNWFKRCISLAVERAERWTAPGVGLPGMCPGFAASFVASLNEAIKDLRTLKSWALRIDDGRIHWTQVKELLRIRRAQAPE